MRDELTSILSHEVRVGLATMRVSLDLLQNEDVLESPVAPKLLAQLERSFSWVESMIENTDWVHQPSGLDLDDVATVSIRDVIDPVVSLLSPLLARRDQKLTVRCPSPPPFLRGDARRLSQVVCNLLTNASAYSPSGLPISLDVTLDGTEICVRVSDHGPGLLPDEQDSVFDRGVRGAAAVCCAARGLGLGLYLARCFVQAHHGMIGVDNVAGAGASFWFTLPAFDDTGEPI